MTKFAKKILGGLGVVVALAAVSATANPSASQSGSSKFDPLMREAPQNDRAAQAMLVAIARAGTRQVVVGERGSILLSDDNGKSWKQASVPVSVLLTGVKFATPEIGWAVGHSGVVLSTTDGGSHWTKVLDGVQAAQLVFKAATRAVEEHPGDESLKRQLQDAERYVADGADKPYFDIFVKNDKTALIIGAYGLALRTEDGGESWIPWQSHIPNPKGAHLYAIRSVAKSLYIAGEQGVLFVSKDGGETFSELKTPYGGSFFGLLSATDDTLVAFGLRGNAFWSADGGMTWSPSRTETKASLTGGIRTEDGLIILVSLDSNVIASRDNGKTFSPLAVPTRFPFSDVIQGADKSLTFVGARGVARVVVESSELGSYK